MKKCLLVAGIVGGLAWASIVVAAPGPRGDGKPGGPDRKGGGWAALLRNDEVAKELGVTDAQRNALKEAMYRHRKEMIKLRAESEAAHLEVKRLLDADSPVADAVMKALDESIRLEGECRKAKIRQMLQVREILGPETARKVRQYAWEHRRQWGGGYGPGRGERPGPRGGRDDGFRRQGSEDRDQRAPAWKQERMLPRDAD